MTALLMEKEPTNMQAQSLATLIDKKVARGTLISLLLIGFFTQHEITDGYIGMALVGGVAAVGALVAAGLIRRATRK